MRKREFFLGLLFFALFIPAYAEAASGDTLTDNQSLVGYWNFDGDIKDGSGHQLNGTTSGGKYVRGVLGDALWFNGVTDEVKIPHNDIMNLSEYSISLWVRSEDTKLYTTLVRKGVDEKENYKLLLKYAGRIGMQSLHRDKRLTSIATTLPVIKTEQWHHVVSTYNGTIMRVYVDGVQVIEKTITTEKVPQFSTDPLLIGNESNIYNRGFKGTIDEVKLFNRALTVEEITKEYTTILPDPARANLLGYWSFEGNAKDALRTGNDGAVKGAVFKTGKVGNALDFNGRTAYVEIPYSKSIDVNSYTVSAWVQMRDLRKRNYIFSKGAPGNENFELSVGKSGELYGFIKFEDTVRHWFSTRSQVITPGEWVAIAETYDNNVFRIFVNGEQVYEKVLFGKKVPKKTASPLFIGKKGNMQDAYFDGLVDEVRLYNRALTPEQILKQYQEDQGEQTQGANTKKQMVGYWNFEDTIEDMSSARNVAQALSPLYEAGKYGKALVTNDRNDLIRVKDSNALDLEAFTISTWVNLKVFGTNMYIYAKGAGNMMNYALIVRSDGGLTGYITKQDGNMESLRTRGNVMKFNTWQHVTMQYEPGYWRILVDGVVVEEGSVEAFTPQINATDLFVGNISASGRQQFQGSIDELKLYNYVLSLDEVKEAAKQGAGKAQENQVISTVLKNGSFEEGIKNWTTLTQANEVLFDGLLGKQSVKVKGAKGVESGIYQNLGLLKKGEVYKVTVAMKANSPVRAQLLFSDREGADPLDNVKTVYKEGNGQWQRLEITHELTHDDTMGIYLLVVGDGEGNEAVFDDVTIERVR